MSVAAGSSERLLFAVDGLWCGGCARGLETRLGSLEGVIDASVHFVTSSALVRWDPRRCDRQAIRRCIGQAGYRLLDRNDPRAVKERLSAEVTRLSIRLAVAVLFGMWSMGAAVVLYLQPDLSWTAAWWLAAASGIFAAPVMLYSAADILRMGVRSVTLRAPGMDLLVTLGVIGSVGASVYNLATGSHEVYFDTATLLVTLLLLGRLIETQVRSGAVEALIAMGDLFDETTKQETGPGRWKEAPCSRLEIGDIVMVDAGSVSTVDGVILTGRSALDNAILTGESVPVEAGPGGRISAGSVNLTRPLRVRVDRLLGDRDVDRMGGRIAVELAARGEPVDSTTRIARLLVSAIPVLAAGVAAWAALSSGSLETGVVRGLVVLLVACPCALAIAAPLVQMRATVVAARLGLRIADPSALEPLAAIRTAIFDKTGTLTLGRPEVVAVEPAAGYAEAEVIALAALAETGIDHPLARAIIDRNGGPAGPGGERAAREAGGLDPGGRRIRVAACAGALGEGLTRLEVSRDGRRIGVVSLSDALDPRARSAVEALRADGVVIKLATGDAPGPARAMARRLGLSEAFTFSGCTPDEKAELVRSSTRPVLFVGDGVNDGPALAATDCGMSVCRAHPAAAATAALAIVDGGIDRVVTAIVLARRVRRLIRQNIGLSLIYNLVAVPAAALGVLSPASAAVAMFASSLIVVANAHRLDGRATDH